MEKNKINQLESELKMAITDLEYSRKETQFFYEENQRLLRNQEVQEAYLKEMKECTRLNMIIACNMEEQTKLFERMTIVLEQMVRREI